MRVQIGNPAPKGLTGRRVTTVDIPESYTLLEQVATIVAGDGVWNNHSQGDAVDDVTPDWVDSDDPTLTRILAQHFGCREKRPRDWTEELDDGDLLAEQTADQMAVQGKVQAILDNESANDDTEGEATR